VGRERDRILPLSSRARHIVGDDALLELPDGSVLIAEDQNRGLLRLSAL
jgi:hypothetical protein